MISNSILDCIGSTPLIRLNRIASGLGCNLFGKLESQNPGGSVKDRVGLSMVHEAEKQGLIDENSVIIEPTS